MAPHGTRIDIHLQTELDLEQLSDRYLFTLKQTASTATQKQTKNCETAISCFQHKVAAHS